MPATPEASGKIFTVDEARALLPVIRPVVDELVETFRKIRAEIESASGQTGLSPDSPDLSGHLQSRGVVPGLFEKVQAIVERIHVHGCFVNGPEAGLIDFPCLFNNEIVFLCWKHGEATIAHWHRIPDGFAGRRPLLDDSQHEPDARVH